MKSPAVDEKGGVYGMIALSHFRIHEGRMFSAGAIFGTVADNANVDLLIRTGTKEVHLSHVVSVGGDSRVFIFEGVTAATSALSLTPRNNNREKADDSDVLLWLSPTITGTGLTLFSEFTPGGQKQFATGGGGGGREEIILSPNIDYAIRAENISGSAITASIGIEFYEVVGEE